MKRGTVTPTQARADIQALRAFAVGIVVLYHLFGRSLPGGFTGVDVFFAISGFLITTHLFASPPGSVTDLLTFWGRRIRRLLPASLTVLTATVVASYLWLPTPMWSDTIAQVRGAALYVVNFTLQHQAVSYLHSGDAATPVQHYWSLAVEEQFYLVWPLLILVLALLIRLIARRIHVDTHRWIYGIGLLGLSAASLTWSIHATASEPAPAYFSFETRIWELGAGGLLAVIYPLVDARLTTVAGGRLRTPIALVGWGLMTVVAFGYSDSTPFPSWRAGLPVLGAVLVIGAASTARIFGLRIFQWLGDRSYSIYLWHWPVWVIVLNDGYPDYRGKFLTIAMTIALSWLTYKLIETPFRERRFWRPLVPTYALGAGLMAVTLAATAAWAMSPTGSDGLRNVKPVDALTNPPSHVPSFVPGNLTPSLTDPNPFTPQSTNGCALGGDTPTPRPCYYGSGSKRVVLFGDSISAAYASAVAVAGHELGYRIEENTENGCTPGLITHGAWPHPLNPKCDAWRESVIRRIASDPPDAVILASFGGRGPAGVGTDIPKGQTTTTPWLNGYRELLSQIPSQVPIIILTAVTDTGIQPTTCLARHLHSTAACSMRVTPTIMNTPAVQAERIIAVTNRERVHLVDLTGYYCSPYRCPPIIGNVRVWADTHHFTDAFSRLLGPVLAKELRALQIGLP